MIEEPQLGELLNAYAESEHIREWRPKREEWHAKYSEWLNPKTLRSMDEDELRERFLDFFDNGGGVGDFRPRYRKDLTKNVERLRRLLLYLVDETIPVSERLDTALYEDIHIEGMGKALATTILYHFNDSKYVVWNGKVENGLKSLGLFPSKKRSESDGEFYLGIIEIEQGIRRIRPSLTPDDVDHFLHWVFAEEDGKKARELAMSSSSSAPTFSFVRKDFESCTGKRDDALYLSRRFRKLLQVIKKRLGPRFRHFTRSYSARAYNQGSKKHRDHMWLGLAHEDLNDKPQRLIQLQVAVNPHVPFSRELFIDSTVPKMRKRAKANIEANRGVFLELIRGLEDYRLGYIAERDVHYISNSLTEAQLDDFLYHVGRTGVHVYVDRPLTRRQTIALKESVIDEILESWEKLLPIYHIMAFGDIGEIDVPTIPVGLKKAHIKTDLMIPADFLDQVCANVNAGRNVIITGPVGTGKTTIAQQICEAAKRNGFCSGYVLTTATSDWTTFDTIGGYVPTEGGGLAFEEGKFLQAIRKNKWLIIDEINRADIDKAFGQLFTVLSGQNVELPFRHANGEPISIKNAAKPGSDFDKERATYNVGENWRILATMNVYDKNFLFEMSYAFMRRFAFVYLDVPDDFSGLVQRWCTEEGISDDTYSDLIGLLQIEERKLGPAVLRDMVNYMKHRGSGEKGLAEAIVHSVLPQFEGLEREETESVWRAISDIFSDIKIPNDMIMPVLKRISGYKLKSASEEE